MHQRRYAGFAAVLFLSIGCGGGCGGCSGAEDYVYPSRPAVDTVPVADAMKLRLTRDGLDFFRQAIPPLLDQALANQEGQEGEIEVPVPGTVFNWGQSPIEGDIFVADGRGGSPVSTMSIFTQAFRERLSMSFLDERDGIQLTIRDLQIGLNVILGADVGLTVFGRRLTGIDAACVLGNGNGGPPEHALRVTVDIKLFPSVDNEHQLDVDVDVRDVSIDGVDLNITAGTDWRCADGDLCVLGLCLDQSDRECSAVLCPALDGVFNVLERLVALIEPALTPVLTNLGEFIVNNLVPPTPLESDLQLQTGDLIADLSSLKRAKPLGIHAAAMGGAFQVNCDDRDLGDCEDSESVGMDIAMELGFEAVVEDENDFPAGCVMLPDELPRFSAPTPVTLPPRWVDDQGEQRRYALGFGLSESGLNQLGWSIFTSGMLCIDLTTADIGALTGTPELLSSGMFGLLAGEIMALAGPSAPVMVRLRPTTEPRFDMIAEAGPSDPQMRMELNEMKMEVFIAIDQRFVRAFAVLLNVDMALQLSPEADEEGTPLLVVQVADGPNIGDFDVVYDEPVVGSDIGGTLPALIDLVLGNFLQDSLRFEVDLASTLGDALGTPVSASVDHVEVRGAEGDELAVYTNLAVGEALPSQLDLNSAVASIDHDSLIASTPTGLRATGAVRLLMEGAADLEYSYRVGGGPWRAWTQPDPAGWLTLRQPKLGLVGVHHVELRARPVGDWRARPKALAPVTVRTSAAPPVVELIENRTGWTIQVLHSSDDQVSVFVRWGEDSELARFDERTIERDQVAPGTRVEVVAVDRWGRRSAPARLSVANSAPTAATQAPPAAAGCSHQAVSTLMLLALVGIRRRSRARVTR
ncbi:MAG: hypothetical protein VYB65_09855 [Myxococcota bacterium]|nr:hypothetical protein [Myxococcota bacterium]